MSSNPEIIAKICVNVLLIAIVAISTIHGWKKGFASVILSCLRWFICVVGAFFAAFPVRDYLNKNTSIDDSILSHIKSTLNSSVTGSSFFAALPDQLKGTFSTYQQSASNSLSTSMADTMMMVLAFLLSLIVLVILTKLLQIGVNALSKDKDNVIGIFNAMMGGLFGLLRGALIVGIIMLALFPLLSFTDPRAISPIVNGIRQSEIASIFYDHNPLLMLFQMF